MPAPLIRKVPISGETHAGNRKPYVYQTPCVKCKRELTEMNVWEAVKWDSSGERRYRLLCEKCAKRAIRYYRKDE